LSYLAHKQKKHNVPPRPK